MIDLSPQALERALEWVRREENKTSEFIEICKQKDISYYRQGQAYYEEQLEHVSNIEAILETLLKLAERRETK